MQSSPDGIGLRTVNMYLKTFLSLQIIRLRLYFKAHAHDFSLLMNLLAESQGLPDALRVLSIFEHEFSLLWAPVNIRLVQSADAATPKLIRNERGEAENNKEAGGEKEEEEKKEREKAPQTLVVAFDDAAIASYFHE